MESIFVVFEGKHDLFFFHSYIKKVYGLVSNGRNSYSKDVSSLKTKSDSHSFYFTIGTSKQSVLLDEDENKNPLRTLYPEILDSSEFSKLLIIFDPDEDNKTKFEKDKKQLAEKLENLVPNHNKEIIFGDWKFDCPKFHGQKTIALENITTFLLRKIEPKNYPEKEIETFLKATNGKSILEEEIKLNNKFEPNICKVLLEDKNLQSFYKKIVETTDSKFLKETVSDKFGVGKIFKFLNDENTQEK